MKKKTSFKKKARSTAKNRSVWFNANQNRKIDKILSDLDISFSTLIKEFIKSYK